MSAKRLSELGQIDQFAFGTLRHVGERTGEQCGIVCISGGEKSVSGKHLRQGNSAKRFPQLLGGGLKRRSLTKTSIAMNHLLLMNWANLPSK